MSEPYNQGGVIPGADRVEVKIQPGERVITAAGIVYELQEVEGGVRWVEIGEGYECWVATDA